MKLNKGFYTFIRVAWQKDLCSRLGLRGRIFIAFEGINGTLGGSEQAIEEYVQAMRECAPFEKIDFKIAEGGSYNFPRLSIRRRQEIVALGLDPEVIRAQDGGKHLKPEEVHALLLQQPENVVMLDARNEYEWRIGRFRNAITLPIHSFREFPRSIDEKRDLLQGKHVIMYCTGGVRCERASAYLKHQGIQEVSQIEGGIDRYIEKYPDGFFRGKNYVFDSRVAVRVNDDVIATCSLCEKVCDDYANCLNASCNKLFICCQQCLEHHGGTCSSLCRELLAQGVVAPRPRFKKEHTS